MILVDSSVWIDYFNGRKSRETDFLHISLGREEIGIGDLIMLEVLQGFIYDQDLATAQELFEDLLCYDLGGKDMALRTAQNYRELRRKGVTIRKTIDMVIGTFCIAEDIRLLHSDRDFEPMVEHLGLRSIF